MEKPLRYEVQLHERIFTVIDHRPGLAVAPKNATRGEVKGISRKARYRLVKLLAQINRPDAPLFVTLTYREYGEDWEQWKAHLRAFRNRVEQHYPLLAAVWRLEFQQRGAPHYHILLWLGEEDEHERVYERMRKWWLRIIGQTSQANQKWGVTVEPVDDWRRTAFYIGAYQSKDRNDRDDIHTGREWGVWHKPRLCTEPIESVSFDEPAFKSFRRIVRRGYAAYMRRAGKKAGPYLRSLGRDQAFTSFMPYAESLRLARWVQGLPVEHERCYVAKLSPFSPFLQPHEIPPLVVKSAELQPTNKKKEYRNVQQHPSVPAS